MAWGILMAGFTIFGMLMLVLGGMEDESPLGSDAVREDCVHDENELKKAA